MTKKVVIAGSRTFKDYTLLVDQCNRLLRREDSHDLEFVSGGARGTDRLGERYVRDTYPHKKPKVFRPDYKKYPGKIAPLVRNLHMAQYAEGGTLIAFLAEDVVITPKSTGMWSVRGGTLNMVMNALVNSMDVHVIRFEVSPDD